MTSRFLWLAPYTNEILDVDTSKRLEPSFGAHTSHNTAGNVRSLVAKHVTELKNFNFWIYQEIAKLKDSQLEIREVEKNSSSGKEMGTGVPVTAYGRNRRVTV